MGAVYLFVLALFVEAGGEDMSSDLLQPMNNADTAATKNNNFFISV
jgi:hypothetical protein